jgi:hypothetical protein
MSSSISFKYVLQNSLYTLPLVGIFSLFLVNQINYIPILDDVDVFAQTDTLFMTKDSCTQTDTLFMTTDSGAQTDTLFMTTDSGAQTDTRVMTKDSGAQTDTRVMTTDSGAQTDTLFMTTDSGAQTDIQLQQNGEDEDEHYEKIQRNAVPSVKAGWFGYAF